MSHEYIKVSRGEKVQATCLRCGRCCRGPNVSLTAFDICRVANFLGVDWRELRGKYMRAVIADVVPIPILQSANGVCAFLVMRDKPTCTIYPARPMKCRLYPFLSYSPARPDLIYLDKCCEGVDVGEPEDPPWTLLSQYHAELKLHYTRLYQLIFEEGYESLQALEKLIDEICVQAR